MQAVLLGIGLHVRDLVRFRNKPNGRWVYGHVVALEADGSLGLSDEQGRRRSLPHSDVEVARRGPRGARIWVSVVEVIATTEQLELF